jgi:acyl-coenzyme A thioesterase PaaI-like protein
MIHLDGGKKIASMHACIITMRIDMHHLEIVIHTSFALSIISRYQAMGLSQGKSFGDEDFPIVVTANLTVNYRSPLPAGSDVVIRVRHEKTEGRKIYVSARMESHDGSVLYSEATALFITVKKQHFQN